MRRGPERGSSRLDLGAAFIEMLVSVVLIGTVGVAVLTALAAAATGARVHSEVSEAQAWLANAGDALVEAESFYLSCDAEPDPAVIADQYEAQIIAPITVGASAPTIDIIDVEFWDSTVPGYSPVDACNYSTTQEDRLQRITLQTTIDGQQRQLTVVKRPDLPPTINTQPPPTTLGGGNVIPPPTPGLP